MKKILTIAIMIVIATSAFAQLRLRLPLSTVKIGGTDVNLEVLKMDDNGKYYLSVGKLGIGDDIVQFRIDPISELFIPLGSTLEEAQEKLEAIQDAYNQEPDESSETQGCLCVLYPEDEFETVYLTPRKVLFGKVLEFSVQRGDLVRATHIARSNFNSLVGSFKIYRKIHPKEQ